MKEDKICPMLSKVVSDENRYGGKMFGLHEEYCRREYCAWWDEKSEKCSIKSIANFHQPKVINFDGELSKAEFEKIKKKFEQRYSGPEVLKGERN